MIELIYAAITLPTANILQILLGMGCAVEESTPVVGGLLSGPTPAQVLAQGNTRPPSNSSSQPLGVTSTTRKRARKNATRAMAMSVIELQQHIANLQLQLHARDMELHIVRQALETLLSARSQARS